MNPRKKVAVDILEAGADMRAKGESVREVEVPSLGGLGIVFKKLQPELDKLGIKLKYAPGKVTLTAGNYVPPAPEPEPEFEPLPDPAPEPAPEEEETIEAETLEYRFRDLDRKPFDGENLT